MPFKKTSLASRQRKKKIIHIGKKTLTSGKTLTGVFVSALVAIPLFTWRFLRKKREQKRLRGLLTFGAILSIFIILLGFFWTEMGKEVGKEGMKKAVFALGAELPKDEHGFTNFLLLGSGGGEVHEGRGHNLTDSIMIGSVDVSGRSVVLLSIPRDFWIDLDKDFLDATGRSGTRINSIVRDWSAVYLRELRNIPENKEKRLSLKGQERKEFDWELDAQAAEKATNKLREKIEEIFEIDIHRTVKIDFRGFEKAVDAIGGIDVVVEESIYDPCYPNYEWGYDPFLIEASPELQHLDSRQALQYARSRHNYYREGKNNSMSCGWVSENLWNTSSDFERSYRQQKVLSAIKEKMTSAGVLTSPEKLKALFDVVDENYKSDTTWSELITLGELASKLPRDDILSFVLNDNELNPGGFLVTPNRELYGGAFVLVPFLNLENDKYSQIRTFKEMIFLHRDIAGTDPIPFEILNGTKIGGLAGKLQTSLERYGWKVAEVANVEFEEEGGSAEKTVLEYSNTPRFHASAKLLQDFMPIELKPLTPEEIEQGLYTQKKIEEEEEDGSLKLEAGDENLISNDEGEASIEGVETEEDKTVGADSNTSPTPEEPQEIFQIVIGTDYETPYRIPSLSPKTHDQPADPTF